MYIALVGVCCVAPTAVTSKDAPDAGSLGRGYGWFVALLSSSHVNVTAPSSNTIFLPTPIPCCPILRTKSPVLGSYVVPVVAVNNLSAPAAPTLTVIEVDDFAVIGIDLLDDGSMNGRGYVLVLVLPSIVQVNDNELLVRTIPSPTSKV